MPPQPASNGFPQLEHGRNLNKSCPRFEPTVWLGSVCLIRKRPVVTPRSRVDGCWRPVPGQEVVETAHGITVDNAPENVAVPHRPRLPSYPANRLRDLYGSLSALLGIRRPERHTTPPAAARSRRRLRSSGHRVRHRNSPGWPNRATQSQSDNRDFDAGGVSLRIAPTCCRTGKNRLCRLTCGVPFRRCRDFAAGWAQNPRIPAALRLFHEERRRITKPALYRGSCPIVGGNWFSA